MKIAFDLDNSIVNFNQFLSEVCLLKFGKTFDPKQMQSTRARIPGVSDRRMEKLAFSPFIFRNAPIIDPNIPSILKELHQTWGCEIVIITHRYQYPEIVEDTHWWLSQYKIHYDWIAFTQEKQDICLANRIPIIVDDHPKVVHKCAAAGIKVFVPPHSYNQTVYGDSDFYKNIHRLPSHNWLYLLEQIKIEIEKRRT